MKLTTDQIKQIISDAPEGATHVAICEIDGLLYLQASMHIQWKARVNNKWLVHDVDFKNMGLINDLSDLRTILEQYERIEALEKLGHDYISILNALIEDDYTGYLNQRLDAINVLQEGKQ